VRSDPRRAADVIRYNSWPCLVQQTTGQHTWQVMRILSSIWPEVTAEAMVFALHHDSGELGSGDIPYPHKALNPALKSIMDGLEERSLQDQGIDVPDPGPEWRWRIKTADLIEMFEKGMDETIMGNRYGVPVLRGMEGQIMARIDELGLCEDTLRVAAYMTARWERFRQLEALK
jgi:5'-deoxynucleotidase YfbR-like HD superfamily hydrolase